MAKQREVFSPSHSAENVILMTFRSRRFWIVEGFTVLIACAAELLGTVTIPAGVASITILPMVWGLIAGGIVSSQHWRPFAIDLQQASSVIMRAAVLLLVARLSFSIGPNISLLVTAGPALLLQELGHLFGTIVFALPLAVLLKMGPATIGATFSIDRESSFAMVSERYGTDSPEYRGVLAMDAFGTLFGAITVGIIASVTASLGAFDPLALAMGAGVGSGSMMAAAIGATAAAHPELTDELTALAATSNLITSVLGVYVGMYIALPLAHKLYYALSRRIPQPTERPNLSDVPQELDARPRNRVSIPTVQIMLLFVVIGTIVSTVNARAFSLDIVWTYVALTALAAIGMRVSRITHEKVGAMVVTMTLGAILTSPISPIANFLTTTSESVTFLSVCTVVLTIAGLSLGKDLPALRTIGWKIIPVGLVAITASYILSVIVAEFALGFWS